jgi:hypothetical protein
MWTYNTIAAVGKCISTGSKYTCTHVTWYFTRFAGLRVPFLLRFRYWMGVFKLTSTSQHEMNFLIQILYGLCISNNFNYLARCEYFFVVSYHHSYHTVYKGMWKYLTNYYIDSINKVTLISVWF